ncbi:MerR family transcriptional regulator [Streptomyces sp. NPDC006197]|uniref:MerR family transcriptional regulator n=1 Tax=Streptomyces sp. NPDC006197 TaxID=3156685 RepID=UPI0033B56E80
MKSARSTPGEGVGCGIAPLRSEGGHRRYSRYQLRIAARARELVDQGTPIEAACRIIVLEDQLEEAQRINAEYRRAAETAGPSAAA